MFVDTNNVHVLYRTPTPLNHLQFVSLLLTKYDGVYADSWYIGIAKRMNVEVNLPNIVSNNDYQKNAIKKALTTTFTLIHGPPGN